MWTKYLSFLAKRTFDTLLPLTQLYRLTFWSRNSTEVRVSVREWRNEMAPDDQVKILPKKDDDDASSGSKGTFFILLLTPVWYLYSTGDSLTPSLSFSAEVRAPSGHSTWRRISNMYLSFVSLKLSFFKKKTT